MKSEDRQHEEIWAYLHDEMSPEERSAFEVALEQDQELQEAYKRLRIWHNELRSHSGS